MDQTTKAQYLALNLGNLKGPGPLNLGNLKGLGPLGNFPFSDADPGSSLLAKTLSLTIGILTLVAFFWFMFILITGGLAWLSSGGDKAKVQEAQKRITNGFIGLIIVLISYFIIKLIGYIFKIDILDLGSLLNQF